MAVNNYWDQFEEVKTSPNNNDNNNYWDQFESVEENTTNDISNNIQKKSNKNPIQNIIDTFKWVAQTPFEAYKEGKDVVEIGELETKNIFNAASEEDKKRLQEIENKQSNEADLYGNGEYSKYGINQNYKNKQNWNPQTWTLEGTGERLSNAPKIAYVEAFKMLPTVWETIKSGAIGGGVTAGTFALVPLVAGQMGPQVALPEEVATVPAAAGLGFLWGSRGGAAKKAFEIEAGNAYNELKNIQTPDGEYIDPNIAKAASIGVGGVNAILECVGLHSILKIVPGGQKILNAFGKEGVKAVLKNPSVQKALMEVVKNYAVGTIAETSTEMAQECTNIIAEAILNQYLGNEQTPLKDNIKRIFDTGLKTFGAMIFTGGAGSVASTTNIMVKKGVDEKTAKKKAQEMTLDERVDYTINNFDDAVALSQDVRFAGAKTAMSKAQLTKEQEIKKGQIQDEAFKQFTGAGVQEDLAFDAARLISDRAMVNELRYGDDAVQWYNRLGLKAQNEEQIKSIAEGNILKGGVERTEVLNQSAQYAGATENEIEDAAREYKEKGVESKYFKKWTNDAPFVSSKEAPKYNYKTGEKVAIESFHGTRSIFDIFDSTKKGKSSDTARVGFWFGDEENFAKNFANGTWWGEEEKPVVMHVYISMKNPKVYEEKIVSEEELNAAKNRVKDIKNRITELNQKFNKIVQETGSFYKATEAVEKPRELLKTELKEAESKYAELRYTDPYEQLRTDIRKMEGGNAEDANFGGLGMVLKDPSSVEKFVDKLKEEGYDGIIIKGTRFDSENSGGNKNNQYAVFSPEQIKSVDNQGTFDANNPNIYHQPDLGAISSNAINKIKNIFKRKNRKIADLQNNENFKGIEEFFEDIKDVKLEILTDEIRKEFRLNEECVGVYDYETDTIYMNKDIKDVQNVLNFKHTLLHECVHAKQQRMYDFAIQNVNNKKLNIETRNELKQFIEYVKITDKAISAYKEHIYKYGSLNTKNKEIDTLGKKIYNEYNRSPLELDADNTAIMLLRLMGDINEEEISNHINLLEISSIAQLSYSRGQKEKSGILSSIRCINEFNRRRRNARTKHRRLGAYLPNYDSDSNVFYQSAYHGTPHNFDEFSTENIGSGEGNQSHGWGLYFAENRNVSERYRENLSYYRKQNFSRSLDDEYDNLLINGKPILENYDIDIDRTVYNYIHAPVVQKSWLNSTKTFLQEKIKSWEELSNDKDYPFKDYAKTKVEAYQRLYNDILNGATIKDKSEGQLFEVDIPESDVLLDEDKKFSEQSKNVQEAIKKLYEENWEKYQDNNVITKLAEIIYTDNTSKKYANNLSYKEGKYIYEYISEMVGSDKAASELLNKYGIKGITYDGSQDGRCYVIFDDDAIEVIQKFYQDEGKPRGQIELKKNEAVITLLQGADKSTLAHELGHLFLDDLNNAAQTNEVAREDLLRTNAWLGHYGDGEYTVAQHEKFAKGFELYLMTGKAPNARIKNVFDHFKEWLKQIYNSAESLGVELSDQAMEIYDSLFMHKTDDEVVDKYIEQARIRSEKSGLETSRLRNDYKEAAYDVLAFATGKNKKYLKSILENPNSKRNAKRIDEFERLLSKVKEGDIFATNKDLFRASGWGDFFNVDIEETNATEEIVEQAYDVIMNKTYLNDSIASYEFALNQTDVQYQYLMKKYRQNTGDERDYVLAALYKWIGKIEDPELQEAYSEKLDLDTKDVERYENKDQFERAKEDILKGIEGLSNTSDEFKNMTKRTLDALNFLTANDKAKIFYNLIQFKNVNDLKNNLDEIMDVSKCMTDMSYRRALSDKIQKALKGTKNIKVGNKRVGKYDYQTNKIFEELRSLNTLTRELAEEKLEAVVALFGDMEQNGDSFEFEERLRNKFLYYKANSHIYLSSDFLESLYNDIIDFKRYGRNAKEYEKHLEKLNRFEHIDELARILKKKKKANFLSKMYSPLLANWESAINLIFNKNMRDKYSLLYDESQVDIWKKEQKDNFYKEASNALGIKGRALDNMIIDNLAEKHTFIETIGKQVYERELTKMDIILAYIWAKNDLLKTRLINQFGDITLNSMFSRLNENDIKLADVLQKTANKFYDDANRVYIKKYGIELPKVQNYFPSKTERVSELDLLNDYSQRSSAPSFIKSRTNTNYSLMQFANPIQMLYSHIDKMGRFIFLTEKLDIFNRIFHDPGLKRAITDKYGKETHKALVQMLANSSYTKKAAEYDGWGGVLNSVVNNWVSTKIALKPSIMLKQLVSVVNYAENMPATLWGANFIKGLLNPIGTIKFMMRDPYLKARFDAASQSEFLQEAVRSAQFSKTKHLKDFFTLSVRLGDIGAIIFGGKPYVDYLIKHKKMSEEEAFKEFRLATLRSQQASMPSSLSNFQNNLNNPLVRALFSFRNTSNQYMRKVADAINSIGNGDKSLLQGAKEIFIYTFINGFMYRALTSLAILRFFATGDDDDLLDDVKMSIFDINSDAIPLIGDAYKYALSKFNGNYSEHSKVPVMDDLFTMIDKVSKDEVDFEDFLYCLENITELTTGVPISTVHNMGGGLLNIQDGYWEEGLMRLIGYTESRARRVMGRKKKK